MLCQLTATQQLSVARHAARAVHGLTTAVLCRKRAVQEEVEYLDDDQVQLDEEDMEDWEDGERDDDEEDDDGEGDEEDDEVRGGHGLVLMEAVVVEPTSRVAAALTVLLAGPFDAVNPHAQ